MGVRDERERKSKLISRIFDMSTARTKRSLLRYKRLGEEWLWLGGGDNQERMDTC